MRASQTDITQDFRLADCKHERLRRALEFRPLGQAPVEVATPLLTISSLESSLRTSPQTSMQTVITQVQGEVSDSREHKRTLVGVIGLFSLACGWFLCGSVASIDFSRFEADLSSPQIISQTVAPSQNSRA